METPQERLEQNRGLGFSEKEILSITDWRDLSFQIGRKSVGGDWNTTNPNISNYRSLSWLNLMTNQRQIRQEGVKYLQAGIMSVVKERKDKGAGELSEYPLQLVANYLHNAIEPNISNRGRHQGAESMRKLKALTLSLFLCDQTPRSIAQVISSFALDNHKR